MYQDFVKNPESVDPEFKKFFEGFDFAINSAVVNGNGKATVASAATISVADKPMNADMDPIAPDSHQEGWMREIRAYRMILGYRNKGHLLAKTNPIRKRKDRGANSHQSRRCGRDQPLPPGRRPGRPKRARRRLR